MLGRPFSIRAKICDGRRLGRTLGFPTVNQPLASGKLAPRYGVYLSSVRLDGKRRYGITNVGLRPTVDGESLCAETHIFDYEGDLYGRTLTVELLEFLRPERRFASVDELSAQVHADMDAARDMIKK